MPQMPRVVFFQALNYCKYDDAMKRFQINKMSKVLAIKHVKLRHNNEKQ